MILTCPACSTRYRTDPDNFRPEGRRVRCSACGDVWFQTPPPDVDDPEFHAEPESPRPLLSAPASPGGSNGAAARLMGARPAPPAPQSAWHRRPGAAFATSPGARSGRFLPGLGRFGVTPALPLRWRGAIGWLLMVALVAFPVGGAMLFRTDIVNTWPKAARIYSALGIPVTDNGLLIHANASKVLRDGRHVIEVRGEIENQGPMARPVPALQLALYDGEQRELYRWVVPVNRMPLDPKGKRAFRTTFPAPGKDVKVKIRFAEDE